MIASVRGKVAAVSLSTAVVEVGGIGIELLCTPNTLATLRTGEEARLPTSLVVREDSLTLFGFTDTDERTLFELLQTASGVGPKLAQAMLAVLSPDGIRLAISTEDAKTLTKVPGIGQKGAQRIILELKDRIGTPSGTASAPSAASVAAAPWRDQVTEALVGLGYSSKDADKAVSAIEPEAGDQANISVLLRAALRTLSKA
ncbi:Holliday junction DNA helicase RuvA [Nocardioides luteus]|uniref:Holliday junction branch migration complex subunit RuvA n=1 Tax=Nocardioides luteus TaxID=1844 RepID=A0ABQ5T0I5_9ACTN|nr:Holliday junction branch migration protein RuvA [Nocardioides luteus]MDR7310897.1 Holliday junction DNA helicase RuvA [Nocardioides luteus]GGR39898.1 Holliday junction ATP-dependent DNA helicase RuvA [Nocardioides luteus]GLJ69323.1 Holliday junction ATP-dependent DNA helicase RuvA [Nocardioides luteus]